MGTKTQRPDIDATAIAEAIESLDPSAMGAWNDLDALSTHTELDGVDVIERSVKWSGKRFEAQAVVYVGLHYGKDDDEGFSTSDSFPGSVTGHVDANDNIVIDAFSVDTSSFYE